jgi:hypothetical protein
LQLFFGDNLGKTMENPQDKLDWFGSERETGFLPELKNFATQHRYTFSPKDINQLKHTMQGMAAIKEGLFEGYYGTRRVSYVGEQTEARLVIKHNRMIGEDDKRYRYVESLFIETVDGERFKLPFVKLSGGRAMLEHVKQGGRPYDIRGQHINEIVTEMAVLSRFNRASQQRVFEGITQELVETVQHYYGELRESLQHMATGRGYAQYFESWTPADIGDETALVEDLKTMFIEQTLDARIEAALPTLAKIQQRGNAMKEAQIFENWANGIMEGTWALPDNPEAQAKLNELMSQELIVGPDATNATEQLYDVIGDDQLFDILGELAAQDPRANIWDDTDVQARLQELGIQLNATPDAEQQQPVAPAAGQQAPGTAPEQGVGEGYTVTRGIDRERYQARDGLEGPFSTKSGKVVYYDKVEGKYYDPDTDMYIEYDEWQSMNEQGVSEGSEDPKYPNGEVKYRIVYRKSGERVEGIKSFDSKSDAQQYAAKDSQYSVQAYRVKQGVSEGSINEGQYEMMMRNGQVKKFIAKDDADAKRIAAGHGAKSVIKLRGGVPAGKVAEQGVAEGSESPEKEIERLKLRQNAEHGGASLKRQAETQARIRELEKQIKDKKDQQGVAENTELATMLKYAGVPLRESVLTDSTGHTLEHILQRFSREVADFEAGAELDNDLFDALYDYYFDDMPYGVKKARTGDPHEWISDRLAAELGITESNSGMIMPEADPIATVEAMPDLSAPVAEGSCNATMEGEYCPEHGLAECGYMESMGGTVAGGIAPVIGEAPQDPINYNAAVTGAYYESKSDTALLARIKSLALIK